MERAGQGATEVLLQCVPRLRRRGSRALVVAGKGNNGGDGFVMARLLKKRGVRVEVALLGREADVAGDALRNLRAYKKLRGALFEVTEDAALTRLSTAATAADAVIDAIFGTGLKNAVRGLPAAAIEIINACGAPVLAVDVPSGLDADTGRPLGIERTSGGDGDLRFRQAGPGAASRRAALRRARRRRHRARRCRARRGAAARRAADGDRRRTPGAAP
jgi:NAD(P)H-hydrate epimerase